MNDDSIKDIFKELSNRQLKEIASYINKEVSNCNTNKFNNEKENTTMGLKNTYSLLPKTKIERFEHFTNAKKLKSDHVCNTYTIYKIENDMFICLDPSDSSMFIIENYEDAAKAYNHLIIKNKINDILNVAVFIMNIIMLIKLLKKKGWIK